jgi:hypothetical protein
MQILVLGHASLWHLDAGPGCSTDRMAVSYYWPNPWQIRLDYRLPSSEVNGRVPEIWTVSYKDENSQGIEVVSRDLSKAPTT